MLEGPIALLRRLPGAVQLLVIGTLVNRAGSFILPFLTLVLSEDFHLSEGKTASLVVAYGVGSLVSILIGGVLTDRLGRRKTLMLSLFGSGALAVAMGLSPSVSVFVPLLVAFGFLADLYRPASSAIISDLLPSKDRTMGFAALRVAMNLGFAIGMALGGLLVGWSWRLLFVTDGLTTAAFGLLVWTRIAETRPVATRSVAPGRTLDVLRDGVFLQLLLASMGFSTLVFTFITVLPLTITRSGHYPAWVYGALVAVNGVMITLIEVPAVAWLARFRRLRVAGFGMLLTGVAFGLVGFVPHWSWYLLTVILWTAGEILTVPQQMAFIADWAPPETLGRYLGFQGATWSLGFALNPLLTLPLHARLPERVFYPLLLLLVAPSALMMRSLDRCADRPELLRGHGDPVLPPLLATPCAEP
jgi:MFS family permease